MTTNQPPRQETGKEYFIYSGEWHSYWRPNSNGYTLEIEEAGRYSEKKANEILAGVGPEKKLKLIEAYPVNTRAERDVLGEVLKEFELSGKGYWLYEDLTEAINRAKGES